MTIEEAPPRSIALVGFGHTNALAPWDEKAWAIWTMNNAPVVFAGRYDALFEMHTPEVRAKERTYRLTEWTDAKITACAEKASVYTLNGTPKGTLAYPIDVMRAYFRRGAYFTSSIAFMMAFAIYSIETQAEKYARTIGVWGIELQASTEYAKERGCFEYWAGLAEGRGITVITPLESPVLSSPYLYGYQAERLDALKVRVGGRQRELDKFIEHAEADVLERQRGIDMARAKLHELMGMRRETNWVLESETDATPHGEPFQ